MSWVRSHPVVSALGVLLSVALLTAIVSGQNRTPDWITTTVAAGAVTETVSVSGKIEAIAAADLTFPATGVVADVAVARGDIVETGTLLATIGSARLAADRAQAVASLAEAEAVQAELLTGQTTEAAAVTETTVANAREALARTQTLAREQVENALIALRSTDLEAIALDPEDDEPAPVVSGSYTCSEDGTYTISVYRSGSVSGYSYTVRGLESGQYTVTTEQPAALGDCGLFLQFTPDETYTNTEWEIVVPNPRSSTYLTRRNAYTLALTQAEQNVAAARDALRLAENQAEQATAGTRVEALVAANARVEQAQARVRSIDAQLQDYAIYAPFTGMVTDILVDGGETVRGETALTLLNTDSFELVARIPEIDITAVAAGQSVTAQFDANPDEQVRGTVTFVSPEAVEIDGVGYFEAVIELDPQPAWLRAGLNADITITLTEASNVLRVPQRFVTFAEDGPRVQVRNGNRAISQPVELGLIGNDGYLEVRNLTAGTEIIAP